MRRLSAALVVLFACGARAQVVLEDDVPAGGPDFFLVPFEVPSGTAELEVAHTALGDDDILDFGLEDPDGTFRGWGGGNRENAVVGERAASRSYLPGPLPEGTWHVVVGKAKLQSAQPRYRIEVTTRTTATLSPQPERTPYAPVTLSTAARYYAGDFHVHSEDSGDADPSLDVLGAFARAQGLDFVVVTDHNTTSHIDRIPDAQARFGELLFVPGVEFTTYQGHATGIGATAYVDHRMGLGDASIENAYAAFAAQGALFSINHPALDLGDLCIGCAWEHPSPAVGNLQGFEVITGRAFVFLQRSLDLWENLLDEGHHLAAIGGSDDHRAGQGEAAIDAPIGEPTTLVFASALSTAALLQGVRDGRTVVLVRGAASPRVDLQTSPARTGDTAVVEPGQTVEVTVVVTGGLGHQLRFVQDGNPGAEIEIDADPFTGSLSIAAPALGDETRVRAEVLLDGDLFTLTSHAWIRAAEALPAECACTAAGSAGLSSSTPSAAAPVSLVGLCLLAWLVLSPRRTR